MHTERRLSLAETLGWTREAPRQAWMTLRGDPSVPPSRFDWTSTRIYTPKLGIATWAGRRLTGRRVPIVNLFNHSQTPPEQGWSVRCTQVRDFRGKRMTYDSHNGTDFALPPGTPVAVSAPGRVVAIRNEYNRGGLKIYVDHGGGLLTTYNHLGRALCRVGDLVGRADIIALSAYSGLDALASFPFVAPHIHYNVALGGVLVDPFAVSPAQTPIWRASSGMPEPHRGGSEPFALQDRTRFDPADVDRLLDDLQSPERRAVLGRESDVDLRGWGLVIEATIYPTRFRSAEAGRIAFGGRECARRATLDLPVGLQDADGICFADELGLRR